jgi:molybdopterin-guanine dinucleotide biosynthesis protein A
VTPERIEPLLAVYEPGAGPNLARLAAEGRTAPRELAGVASVATPNAPPELAAAWTNVNTGEDWERWAE